YEDVLPADLKPLGVPEGAFTVACVANNRRMKGVKYLLKALQYLPSGLPLHILLLGRDMDTPANRKLIRSSEYADRVHFPGFVPEVLSVVKSCQAFVLPSIFGESITKSVLEAMSLGLAPVITDIPGNTELVEHGISGLVVPSRNPTALAKAIARVSSDAALAKNLGTAAKQRIEEVLNHSNTVEGYAWLYRRLAGNGNSSLL
ncbi:MAG: glycosyltransferase, partial [Bacteroidales bacterium]|nr:glycosyltransferase [Bacteroidales bacterium]